MSKQGCGAGVVRSAWHVCACVGMLCAVECVQVGHRGCCMKAVLLNQNPADVFFLQEAANDSMSAFEACSYSEAQHALCRTQEAFNHDGRNAHCYSGNARQYAYR